MSNALSESAKLLLLTALLANDGIVSKNGITFIKELILRRDPRLAPLLKKFESKDTGDSTFVEQIHDLISEESQIIYDELFENTSLEVGKTLSKDERERKKLNQEKSLIYGEVDYTSFYRVLRKINPEPGLIFYDLGSGTGKAVFVARLTQDFSKCIGIEILEGLHTEGESIVKKYNEDFKHLLYNGQANYANVFEGSFLDFDWSDGDVVFANSTCFDDELMAGLSLSAEALKPGAIVVTFTKGMTSRKFEVLEKKRYKMSWGPATVFIHRRLNANGSAVGPSRLNILPCDNVNYDGETDDGAVYNGTSSNYNTRGSDSEDRDSEDGDEEDDEQDYEDGIDEGEEGEEEESEDEEDEEEDERNQHERERKYKQYNHEEDRYESEEDDEERNEDEEEDDGEDLDIDEYIRNITREMREHTQATAAQAASTYAKSGGIGHYHESSPSRDPAYDEEESATGSEEDSSEEDSTEEEEGDSQEEEEESDDGDDEQDEEEEEEASDSQDGDNFRDVHSESGSEEEEASEDEEVRDEMEEQIRLISARIAHNKNLINTYTNMSSSQYGQSPKATSSTVDDSDSDSSGSELQPVSSPAKVIPVNHSSTANGHGNTSGSKASPSHYPPTPPSANAMRAAAIANDSTKKSANANGSTSGTKHSPAPVVNPYSSPVRSTTSSQPSSYTSPSRSSAAGSAGKQSKDPSPYQNAPPKVYASSESGKKLSVSSPTRSDDQNSNSSANEAFAQMTSPQDEMLLKRKRMGNPNLLAGRKLHATDSD